MKSKKVALIVSTLAIVMTMGVTAFAASTTDSTDDSRLAAIESGDMQFGKNGKGRRGMNEEQKAQMDAMNEKWDTLTEEQKDVIYDLNDQKTDIDSKIIDKYLEFGVIDADEAATMKENVETRKSTIRENDRMPMGGMRGMGGRNNQENNCY